MSVSESSVQAFRLSSQQARAWSVRQGGNERSYFAIGVARIAPELELDLVNEALGRIVERNEILRTSVYRLDGMDVPLQVVNEGPFVGVACCDLASLAPARQQAKVDEMIDAAKERILENARSRALDGFVARLSKEESRLYLALSSLCGDATSVWLLLEELQSCLDGAALPQERLQYVDYSEWERELLRSAEMEGGRAYWKERARGVAFQERLAFERSSAPGGSLELASLKVDAPRAFADSLAERAKEMDTSEEVLLLAAWTLLLRNHFDRDEFTIFVSRDCRRADELKLAYGAMEKFLPLAVQIDQASSFLALVEGIAATLAEAAGYQEVFSWDLLHGDGDNSKQPIYLKRGFEYRTFVATDADSKVVPLSASSLSDRLGVMLSCARTSAGLSLGLRYDRNAYAEEAIGLLAEQFEALSRSVVESWNRPLSTYSLVGRASRARLVGGSLAGSGSDAVEGFVMDWVEENAERRPDSMAVISRDASISYSELNRHSNRLARLLQTEYRVGRGDIVALAMEPSAGALVGMIAILKAGAAYLPLDPKLPQLRMESLLADSGSKVVVAQAGVQIANTSATKLLAHDRLEADAYASENLERDARSDDLAYVIYTSGSSGSPKGVMIEHGHLYRYLAAARARLELEPGMSFAAVTSLSTDLGNTSVFSALMLGGALSLIDAADSRDPARFGNYMQSAGVDCLKLTPSHFSELINGPDPAAAFPRQRLIFGGESLSWALVDKIRKLAPRCRVFNHYGPTETTIGAICGEVRLGPIGRMGVSAPLGRPLDNSLVRILDGAMQPVAEGVCGEICISGVSVARGYLNFESDAFLWDPFADGIRMYRTGDIGRWLSDGSIEFVGRRDDQLKVRGYRVELGEIAATMKSVDGVDDAVVRARKVSDEVSEILGYYVGTADEATLRADLDRRLPEHMAPRLCIRVESFPLKGNGKVDMDRLPEPQAKWERSEHVPPATETERALARIWEDLLGSKRVGSSDNFFAIGGHSLRAMRLVTRIQEFFTVHVPLVEVFRHATLRELAKVIDQKEGGGGFEVPAVERRPRYPASSQQRRLYALQQMDASAVTYNVPMAFSLKRDLEFPAIQVALKAIVKRHEPLRTRFEMVDSDLVQIIEESVELEVASLGLVADANEAMDTFCRPFDLSKAPLMRVATAETTTGERLLLVDMHHIVTDRLSNEMLVSDFAAALSGRALPVVEIQYKDYSVWQQEGAGRDALAAQRDYWLSRLDRDLPVLDFPTDFERASERSFEGDWLGRTLSDEQAAELRNLCHARSVTAYTALLALFKIALSKYCGQEELVVGAPVSGRDGKNMDQAMGMFVNMLPILSAPQADKTFAAYLEELKAAVSDALQNQQFPFEQLVEEIVQDRDINRNPIFDFAFGLQEGVRYNDESRAGIFTQLELKSRSSKFDLFLKVFDLGTSVSYEIEYSPRLFAKATIERFAERFERLLDAVCRMPDALIGELRLVAPPEQRDILERLSGLAMPADGGDFHCVSQRVERAAEEAPHSIAVASDRGRLTYAELNQQANRLARRLRERHGVASNDMVAIAMERSVEHVVAIVAVLKAGCAYLPIDAQTPRERVLDRVVDSGVKAVVCDGSFDAAALAKGSATAVDYADAIAAESSDDNLDLPIAPTDLAYVIHTSGSTGKPKGTLIERGHLWRYLQAVGERAGLGECRSFATVSSLATDLGNTSVFSALIQGATLYVASVEQARDPRLLAGGFPSEGIDCLKLTPSHLNELLRSEFARAILPRKRLMLGGETFDWKLLERIENLRPSCQIFNHYGPTETTVGAVCGRARLGAGSARLSKTVPIGKPLANSRVLIVDARGNLIPEGAVGEICIGGLSVARGYLNNEEQTAQRFVANPYAIGDRLYRTGDYGRWLSDGSIEFLGRQDRQIKIRGYRVELDEVESVAKRIDGVRSAYALANDTASGEKETVLYYVGEIEPEAVAAAFESGAPPQLRPGRCVRLAEFPLTLSGKIDKRRLPSIEARAAESASERPASEVEAKLIGIWKEMLALPSVRLGDNFFHIGGHSLRAIRMMTRVRETFGVHVPLTGFFANPTLKALAQSIERSASPDERRVPKAAPRASYPASSQQKRLYALQQFAPESVAYNMPTAHWLRGDADLAQLQEAIDQIVRLHSILRTRFEAKGGRLSQIVEDGARVEIELEDVAELDAKERLAAFVRPFDLQKAPLLRVRVARAPGSESLLLTDMHHIASDGSSRALLVENLYRALRGEALPAPAAQYADYAAWQQEGAGRALIETQKRFWQEQFAESVPALELPTDFERPRVRSYRGSTYAFDLAAETTRALAAYCESKGVTLYMALLAIQGVLLAKHTGQDDLAIGTPSTGRDLGGVEKMLGMFINTLAMRVRPSGEKRFGDYLEEVRRFCSEAFDNQQYPFEDLVESIRLERDMSRNPIFDTMLVVQNYDRNASLEDCGVARKASFESSVSKMDLTLFAREENGILSLAFEYASDLFQRESIDRLANRFARLVEQVLKADGASIDALSVLDEAERAQLCREFNDTEFPIPANGGIAALFEAQVARQPDAPALTFEGQTLTYGELNARANRLAWRLIQTGWVGPEKIVAVAMERSVEQFASVLATLKAGAAYLPIDPTLPAERIRIMLEESRACVALHRGRPIEGFAGAQIDASDAEADSARSENPRVAVAPRSLAYAIFTSGSTGRPKGVLVEQGNVVNFIASIAARVGLGSGDRILCATTIGFDIFALESLAPLAAGASVVLANAEEAIDPARLLELVQRERATVVQFTPSRMRMLLASERFEESMAQVDTILLGGESLPGAMLTELQGRSRARLFNLYGPTETTVWSTAAELTESPAVHVGKPIGNTVVRVLDSRQRLVPIGARGELWIGGAGVARGYLGDEALTRSRFIPDPYDPLGRLYRSGDVARWTAGGDLECFGRIDDQVKVRGHRIELGEIESALAEHAAVAAAAVAAEDQAGGDVALAAYVALRGEASVVDLRRFLGERLPQYMIPGKFFAVDALPLTPSGKIDRRRLAGSGRTLDSGVEYEGARDELESSLLAIWKRILRVESVGVRDNFFDLGGNSIRLLELQGAIEQELDWRVRIVDLFRHSTIRALAESRNGTDADVLSDASAERRVARKDILRNQRDRRLNARAN